MKNKFEDVLYFLTLWFSTSVIVLFVITFSFNACNSNPKPKQIYVLESIPTYDSLGNLYGIKQEYDHVPTYRDSIEFNIESDKAIQKVMDSVYSKNKNQK